MECINRYEGKMATYPLSELIRWDNAITIEEIDKQILMRQELVNELTGKQCVRHIKGEIQLLKEKRFRLPK